MTTNQKKLPGLQLFDLTGKVAIVTGGSKGLGFAMAKGIADAGGSVLLVSRTQRECDAAAAEIEQEYGTKAVGFAVDVTKEEETTAMVQKCIDLFGRIDILINSAGINIRGPIDEISHADFQKVMDINVTGTWLASKAVVPHLKAQKSGKIINLASTLGVVGLANRTPYTASKGAIVNMTKALALELAPFNINVNAICPGPFLTEMNEPIKNTEEGKKFIVGATALERWGELAEIQGVGIFLASDASNYMVGSCLLVDGGWVAR
ncbi:glucose 1-dehydrogenase [Marinilongibacter aquaticus]|uniref:SDR family NAD(P)-dependent oxidoreductase n=1 Tax=Marinilongibacter aquaticus TaxID=2975157 RepID=UPI0021BD8446|nr:glucose 1-dehydrogenase [Marinilongibacter aquaticus]UBM58948.1 glucose 1-dehydrogenase [Marinilongibacter aquaticus]